MKKTKIENLSIRVLYLTLCHLPLMAFGQLPSIDPLSYEFRLIRHGKVDSIIEKRVFPKSNYGLDIYYFDDDNRVKRIVNTGGCGYEQLYFYRQNDTAEIITTFFSSTSKGDKRPLPKVENTDIISMARWSDTSRTSLYKDSMGRCRKIITERYIDDIGQHLKSITEIYRDSIGRYHKITTELYRDGMKKKS